MSAGHAARTVPGLVFGAVPRANLLPPEVLERTKARRTRRYLVFAVLLALVATAGVYAFATIRALTAQTELAAAQAQTAALLQEKATYSEVISATNSISLITKTQGQATSTEILWGDFILDEVGGIVPGAAISRISATSPPPWVAPLAASDSGMPRSGAFELTIATATAPRRSRALPGDLGDPRSERRIDRACGDDRRRGAALCHDDHSQPRLLDAFGSLGRGRRRR